MLSTCSGLPAPARDRGQYAHVDPKMKEWFDSLESRKGPCCSDADGSVVKDADWESRDGHYRVRLQDRWVDVPDEAVVTVPNLFGRTMVWPVYYNGYSEGGNALIYIRCFIPGSMT
jgi:hypothetical protein